jgi:lysine 2,3-aminomutase
MKQGKQDEGLGESAGSLPNKKEKREKEYWKKYKPWKEVTAEQWNSGDWQYHNLIMTVEKLGEIIPLSPEEVEAGKATKDDYKFSTTPYYASLIDPNNPECPIRLQTIPNLKEMGRAAADMRDPLGEDENSPVPGLVHRYPDRVLWLITTSCAMYCRFCTRRRIVLEKGHRTERELEMTMDYLRAHTEIRDVIISGGDSLFLGDKYLEGCLQRLRQIPSIEIIRVASRIPVVCPMRITDELATMLRKYAPIFMMTHFNHPYEITEEAKKACAILVDHGIPIFNQTVLLRKINSDPIILRNLFQELLKNRVKPYYLYQCDLSEGIEHFRTPVQKGIEIIESLRGHTSGLAVPEFVIDAPGGGGKVPVMPQYLISESDKRVVVRNYRGFLSVYTQPEVTDCDCSTADEIRKKYPRLEIEGPEGLLQGKAVGIEPRK